MAKASDAFRTISEVSDTLAVPTHVLRFWETKFADVAPVQRAGGRRYYRPNDVSLLAGIKFLLHEQGMTIKGVQKILRESGPDAVAELVAPARSGNGETSEATPAPKKVLPLHSHTGVSPNPIVQTPARSIVVPTEPIESNAQFESRIIGPIYRADPQRLASQATAITPLLARLAKIHP